MYVHVGGCHMAGERSRGVQRDRRSGHSPTASPPARTAGRTHCRSESELGYLE
ncbi:hypothetical protein [Streptomyces mirabilis]|uniref:hypothetical protein n=1 Tax=Streptomyces mirabilis TaxID=68239 RepID=UPI002253EC96|nr:hypothetical protein [Streptomyces mirabilis]MCX4419367.1 hypothetical protein [Streptomyces mirabilis]